MSQGLWVLLVALVLATAYGGYRARRDGRFAGLAGLRAGLLANSGFEHGLGERATLLQFSSAFCAPCRATRRVLADVAEMVPGVVHVEVDAERHLALVRRAKVTRTPTTLILDSQGREALRAAGAPRKEDVLSALTKVVGH